MNKLEQIGDYFAVVCKLKNVRKHPNADRLQIATALGFNVIVGLDAKEDDLVVLFPSDGCLSEEMCLNNNLYRKHPVTGKEMGGYFEPNGRVKALRLRKASSEAFVTGLSSLDWTGYTNLREGDKFTHINGNLVCSKYYTPATLQAMRQNRKMYKKSKKPEDYCPDFARHFSTNKLRHNVYNLVGAKVDLIVTEKLHGSSGRTGLVEWTKKNWWQNLLFKVGLYKDKYRYVTGTRKVVLNPDEMGVDSGYYSGTTFRTTIHNQIKSVGLNEGEILYYEIVGYTDNQKPIMGTHTLSKLSDSGVPKKEYKKYGETVTYSYGTNLTDKTPFKVFVYRIVQDGIDLSWEDLKKRCKKLNLAYVPELGIISLDGSESASDIMHQVDEYTLGDSVLDSRHFREGVCLRIDNKEKDIPTIYKYKQKLFCILEGIQKNDPNYVDMEEIS